MPWGGGGVEDAYPNSKGGIEAVDRSGGSGPVEGHGPALDAIRGLLAQETSLGSKRAEARCHAYGTGGRGLSGGDEDAREHIGRIQRSGKTANGWQGAFKLRETSTDGLEAHESQYGER